MKKQKLNQRKKKFRYPASRLLFNHQSFVSQERRSEERGKAKFDYYGKVYFLVLTLGKFVVWDKKEKPACGQHIDSLSDNNIDPSTKSNVLIYTANNNKYFHSCREEPINPSVKVVIMCAPPFLTIDQATHSHKIIGAPPPITRLKK